MLTSPVPLSSLALDERALCRELALDVTTVTESPEESIQFVVDLRESQLDNLIPFASSRYEMLSRPIVQDWLTSYYISLGRHFSMENDTRQVRIRLDPLGLLEGTASN